MHGDDALALWNTCLTDFSDSPTYLSNSSGPKIAKQVRTALEVQYVPHVIYLTVVGTSAGLKIDVRRLGALLIVLAHQTPYIETNAQPGSWVRTDVQRLIAVF